MKVFWTPAAITDRETIYAYIEADDVNAAISLDDLFSRAASRPALHQMVGPLGPRR
jgi:plasmid stabilization system protein ParE